MLKLNNTKHHNNYNTIQWILDENNTKDFQTKTALVQKSQNELSSIYTVKVEFRPEKKIN